MKNKIMGVGFIVLLGLMLGFFIVQGRHKEKDKAYAAMTPVAESMREFRKLNGRYPLKGFELAEPAPTGSPYLSLAQIMDPWSTEYRFMLQGNGDCELRSAGMNKIFDDQDDAFLLLTNRTEEILVEGKTPLRLKQK